MQATVVSNYACISNRAELLKMIVLQLKLGAGESKDVTIIHFYTRTHLYGEPQTVHGQSHHVGLGYIIKVWFSAGCYFKLTAASWASFHVRLHCINNASMDH